MHNSSVELWKNFVDSFANIDDGVYENWIVNKSSYPETEENVEINNMLKELSDDHRKIIAKMLIDARQDGVHDALVTLNDRMALNCGRYYEGDIQMEFQPFGSELYYDYTIRKLGEEWQD